MLKSMGFEELRSEVLIQTFRRAGKTWSVSMLLAALLLAGAVFVVNLVWFRPFSLDLFFEKVFIEEALDKPELLTDPEFIRLKRILLDAIEEESMKSFQAADARPAHA